MKTPSSAILDRLCKTVVRSRGACELHVFWPSIPCSKTLQWAHIVSRSYRQVRWNLNNAFCLCTAHHMFFTHRPLQWDLVVRLILGEDNLRSLHIAALNDAVPVNKKEVYLSLTNAIAVGRIVNTFILPGNVRDLRFVIRDFIKEQ